MVPPDFAGYFTAMAGVGATLVGLIFVAVSLLSEQMLAGTAPAERQATAASSFTALLNPLIISLIALIPRYPDVGIVILIMSVLGVLSTLLMGWNLFRYSSGWVSILRKVSLILSSLVLYGFELNDALPLLQSSSTGVYFFLAPLLVGIYVLGIVRAWELLGARRYRLHDLFSPLRDVQDSEARLQRDAAQAAGGAETGPQKEV